MKYLRPIFAGLCLCSAALQLVGCAGMKVTHVRPGESLNVALAQKANLVRLPVAAVSPQQSQQSHQFVASVEPELPGQSTVELVAEAYSRAQFCLEAGKEDEAISAFEEAVKIDPAFTEAWEQLASLYEKKGDSKKAMEAFRRAKKMAQG